MINSSRVGKLLLTGDGRSWHAANRTEADRMREVAIQLGVFSHDIIVEEESQNTIANARKCRDIIRSHPDLQNVTSIVLVSSAWHMLRSFMIMRHHLPRAITVLCHPTEQGYNGDTWATSSEGRRLVCNELRLIGKLIKAGYSVPSLNPGA